MACVCEARVCIISAMALSWSAALFLISSITSAFTLALVGAVLMAFVVKPGVLKQCFVATVNIVAAYIKDRDRLLRNRRV